MKRTGEVGDTEKLISEKQNEVSNFVDEEGQMSISGMSEERRVQI